jgi:hypothetical protein
MTQHQAPGEPIVLAGRTFHLIGAKVTFANDLYIGRELRATGFAPAFAQAAATPELDRERAAAILNAHASGRLCALLAGLLHEDGVKWSQAVAAKTTEFFEDLDEPADKALLLETAVVWIAGFFLNGLGSLPTSPSSSSSAGDASAEKDHERRTAAPSTSANGIPSS